jgi:hypothetical protein
MGNSIWQGHIAFGLVAFPVKLHAAAQPGGELRNFPRDLHERHLLHFRYILGGLGTHGRPMPLP